MRISTFIIGTILATLFMTAFGLILADVNDKYDLSSGGYTAADMETFDSLEETNALAIKIQNKTLDQTTDKSKYDVIGGFLADGRNVLKISMKSFNIFTDLSNKGMDKIGIPAIFRTAFITILIIVVFLGILLSAVMGRRL